MESIQSLRILEKKKDEIDLEIRDYIIIGSMLFLVLIILIYCLKNLLCSNRNEDSEEDDQINIKTRTRFQTLNTNIAHRSIVNFSKRIIEKKLIFFRIKKVQM